ncbi:BQ5605_C001g00861 [Microbotryum silenes-dioicae]|uniref:BQ5605_C001g00861 protein n=1 Tax=Microbotryum silenes-dioicae TaxID=796604 RepID=A0A2X0P0X8_9BASI|nr:BQ5605_C001g00861 [Microbotryum silenes-dioicae]
MPRIVIPTGFKETTSPGRVAPTCTLRNAQGHTFSVHVVSSEITRVVHALPSQYRQKTNGGTEFETNVSPAEVKIKSKPDSSIVTISTPVTRIEVDYAQCPRLRFFRSSSVHIEGAADAQATCFHADSHTRAYSFDAQSGAVLHLTERENYLPVSEHEDGISRDVNSPLRNEFIYGLGESRGFEKTGRKYTFEGRDALAYTPQNGMSNSGDPLYKTHPFYCVYNKRSQTWHGVFYNSLVDSSIDMGAEGDILFGCFRTYKANSGLLDYYVISPRDGSLPSLISLYASLVSPSHSTPYPISASPVLPPLSQFGYLASSLSLAADPKAQEAVIGFVKKSRGEGFPIDGLYLSSGWCQEEGTDLRHYFAWNKSRYPNPAEFGRTVEQDLQVQVIVNVKPWLLETHPGIHSAAKVGAFVRAPKDALGDPSRASEEGDKRDLVWSSGFGAHALGRYLDYSSKSGSKWWTDSVQQQLLSNNLTGIWIDNNEMAGMVDDDATFKGELGLWNTTTAQGKIGDNVQRRMGWGRGETTVGSVGKAVQTMGMARATYEALLSARPNDRPVIVSRSGLPGIQAYAHASWSGDNATTWATLAHGVALTLSLGLSFGPGLYGHDIGGFAGAHHPSAELLIRWCQNAGAYHSRFTVHSWKETSTTMWMYKGLEPGVTEILRDVLAWRYRLTPTMYSLYVTHYHRRGWPVVKPLLWYHSCDPLTLFESQAYLFGSHVLVASVVEFGARAKRVYLPSSTVGEERQVEWCELDTGVWHTGGQVIVMDAPLSRTPTLVRAGGILVVGPTCKNNLFESFGSRHVLIFPSSAQSGCSGRFTLVEDDGVSNEHTLNGVYTEIDVWYRVKNFEEVEVGFEVSRNEYVTKWKNLTWELPKGDRRKIVGAEGLKGLYDPQGILSVEVF